MALSSPHTIYGVHSFAFYNRTTGLPTGILKVLGGVSVAQGGSFNDLFGGSSRYPWDSEPGVLDTSINLNSKQFDKVLWERGLGASVTENAAEASGNVSTITNKSGTSVVNASTGIASIAVTTAADLKTGRYVVKAVSATTVDVYCYSDVDFAEGTDLAFENDALKITASPLTVADTGGTTAIPSIGITITGGSGTVAMTSGHTATFDVRKINSGSEIITVGQSTQTFDEFGCVWTAQRKANGDILEFTAYRAKAIGLPVELSEQAWAQAQVTIKCLYDSTENAVYKVRRIKAA